MIVSKAIKSVSDNMSVSPISVVTTVSKAIKSVLDNMSVSPISVVTPYHPNLAVKGRVIQKSEFKKWCLKLRVFGGGGVFFFKFFETHPLFPVFDTIY